MRDDHVRVVQKVVEAVLGEDAALEIGGKLPGLVGLVVFLPLSGVHVVPEDFEFVLEILVFADGLFQTRQHAGNFVVPVLHHGDPFNSCLSVHSGLSVWLSKFKSATVGPGGRSRLIRRTAVEHNLWFRVQI